jgi:hypothetical protein
MAKKLYDLSVKTGTYQKAGETKNRYQTIGAMFEGERGPFLFLESWFNPAGVPHEEGKSITVYCFEPRDGNESQAMTKGGQREPGWDDDTPFGR